MSDIKKSACGYKGFRTPANDPMHTACEWHDSAYISNKKHGGEELRKQIDAEFYSKMLEIADKSPSWKRPLLKTQAWIYYKLVRNFGTVAWANKTNGI